MKQNSHEPHQEATGKPPIDLLTEALATMDAHERKLHAGYWESTIKDFREKLRAACRENAWEVADCAFGRIIETGMEMLLRSQMALRIRLNLMSDRRGADFIADISEEADRVERVSRFVMEAAERYAKVQHVIQLARRAKDPKIVQLDDSAEQKATGS